MICGRTKTKYDRPCRHGFLNKEQDAVTRVLLFAFPDRLNWVASGLHERVKQYPASNSQVKRTRPSMHG
jgi:hypothetical protein